MSLRVKVELVLFITMLSVVGFGYGIQRFYVLPALNPIEEQNARRCIASLADEIGRQEALLDRMCLECSVDPALVASAVGGHDPDLARILSPDDQLSYVGLRSPDGTWKGAVAPGAEVFFDDLKEDNAGFWSALEGDGPEAVVGGVLLTGAGPMLVASRPVLWPDAPPGRLVLGRLLDRRFVASGLDGAGAGIEVLPAGDERLSAEEQQLVAKLATSRSRYLGQVTDDQVRAYGVYPGITPESSLVLRLVVYRSVVEEAQAALQSGLLVQTGAGLTALVLLIVLFRRTVMDSLTRLTRHTVAVAETNDLTARLGFRRTDEIGTLGREFDRMVARLGEERERQKRAEEALRESEERYVLAVRGANDGLWDWNLRTNEIHYSTRWKTMLGFGEDEIGDSPDEWFGRIHPEDLENVRAALDAHLHGQSAHFESEHRMIPKGRDAHLWVLCRGRAVKDAEGNATRMAGSLTDITLRKLFEEQLSHLALHDPLTSLPNRTLMLDRLGQALKHTQRNAESLFAVLFIDLDRFKVINDGLGHVTGDRLLAAVAERLSAAMRATDTLSRASKTVSRFGGDEFVILLDRLKSVTEATLVAERIQEELRKPFVIDGQEVFTTSSMGIALSDREYQSAEEIVRNADTAMYRAKAGGKDRFILFDSDMGEKAMERVRIETDLRRAVERGEFVVHYQPIVSLATGGIVALEALVRWQHPERGLVPPIDFIPLAEETGMIVPIGAWVLQAACRQTRAWQINIPTAEELCVSVNLSVKDFSQQNLVDRIARQLTETGLSPRHLKLEITETAIIENIESVTAALGRLRDMRVQLAIDDFGTGYSSLSYLHRLPMSTLKIDRAFIKDMETERESLQIVKTILLLARALDVDVISEGIEDARQLALLRDLGSGFGQGFYFSRPLDAESCGKLLKESPKW
jgi:diguanylate cyclase (GGDEF)-like protein/PAS domain S-box-containing protein